MKIRNIEIDKKHRNLGFVTKLYKYLIEYCDETVVGLISYLPDRINNKQIPSIYKNYKTEIIGDYEVIKIK